MALGLIGQKVGMTRLFTDDGSSVPVTVIQVEPNKVTQIKSLETDGYSALQVTTGERKANKINKASAGHFAKAGAGSGAGLWEFRVSDSLLEGRELGSDITFEDALGDAAYVDVTGTSIGKGFAGNVKRNNFHMQDATHGNSLSHRAPGSIGQNQTPGRVFKGKKMAGQMGAVKRTSQSLELVKADSEKGLIMVKGAVPGPKGGRVIVKRAEKKQGAK